MGVTGDQLLALCWLLVGPAEEDAETLDWSLRLAVWPDEYQLRLWSYTEYLVDRGEKSFDHGDSFQGMLHPADIYVEFRE